MRIFLATFTIILLCQNAFGDNRPSSPVDRLRGEWAFSERKSHWGGNILFLEKGRFFHGRFGEGDLKYLGGNRFEITYYSTDENGPGGRKCEVTMSGQSDGSIVMNNLSGSQDCFWEKLTRRRPMGSIPTVPKHPLPELPTSLEAVR